MRILLSAFACSPFTGSEGGVGWRYAVELGKNHQVVVVTDITRRAAIEAMLVKIDLANVKFAYFRPWWLKRIPLNAFTAKLLFTAWQFSLLPFVHKLHQQHNFNVAWHLTYGVYRTPSFLGYIGIPFVFGPVGGGEDAPLRLKKSIHGKEKIKELVRSLANKFAMFNPWLWLALRKTSLIFVKTNQTRNALPWPFRKQAITIQEIGIDVQNDKCINLTQRKQEATFDILYAGNLFGLKGLHMAIRAVSIAQQRSVNLRYTIVGNGPLKKELQTLAVTEGISESVNWVDHIPQAELFKIYKKTHLFLFPSLHDSSGNVVLEAQSFGLPVVCLDLGGPATLVDDSSAIVIETKRKTEKELVIALADAICLIASNEEKRLQLAKGAILKAASQTWAGRVNQLVGIIERTVKQ